MRTAGWGDKWRIAKKDYFVFGPIVLSLKIKIQGLQVREGIAFHAALNLN